MKVLRWPWCCIQRSSRNHVVPGIKPESVRNKACSLTPVWSQTPRGLYFFFFFFLMLWLGLYFLKVRTCPWLPSLLIKVSLDLGLPSEAERSWLELTVLFICCFDSLCPDQDYLSLLHSYFPSDLMWKLLKYTISMYLVPSTEWFVWENWQPFG